MVANLETLFSNIDDANSYGECYALTYRQKLPFLDKGSSRAVFAINDKLVAKVALNHSGVLQNGREEEISDFCEGIPYLSHVCSASDTKRIIVTERLSYDDVDSLLTSRYLIPHHRFAKFINSLGEYIAFYSDQDRKPYFHKEFNRKRRIEVISEEYRDVINTKIGGFSFDLATNERVILTDIAKRNGLGRKDRILKLSDYGMSVGNFRFFHKRLLDNIKELQEVFDFDDKKEQMCQSYKSLRHIVEVEGKYGNQQDYDNPRFFET